MAPVYPEPEIVARKSPRALSKDEIQAAITREIEAAKDFIDIEIAPQRVESMKRYKGEPYADDANLKGRSKVVSRDVRDTIKSIIPSLMKVFFSSEHVVEFVPRRKEAVPMAEQATDYVRYVFNEDNDGFLTLYAAFKDALINKTGVLKWWHEDTERVTTEKYSGLGEAQMLSLVTEEGVEVAKIEVYEDSPAPGLDPPLPMMEGGVSNGAKPAPQPPSQLFDVTIRRAAKEQKFCVSSLAPEEFLINRSATSIQNADLVAHRSLLTASDLLEMGYSQSDIDEVPGDEQDIALSNLERLERSPSSMARDTPVDPSMRRILHVEAFAKIDEDGDGIAELRRICCLGPQFKIIHDEPAEEAPFAMLCPEPEPHEVFGTSIAEIVADIQRIKSQIQRGMLDSLAQSINPRTGVVEGQVNIADVLNNEVGGVIRMRAPGMVQPYETTFLGQAALPVLAYYDDVKQNRTGMSNASMGLDADALQSTTQIAVAATVDAAKQHIELIARIFAETGIKSMFKGLLRLIAKHQDKARTVKLRGKWVDVDPRGWDASMQVSVNVGLGASDTVDRVRALQEIATKQEQIMMQAGPSNPIVRPSQYATTLRKAVELAGFADADLFFSLPTAEQEAAIAQATSQQKQDPQAAAAEKLAQVQVAQIQADMQTKAAELDLNKQKAISELQLKAQAQAAQERQNQAQNALAAQQMAIDERLKLKELELKYSTDLQKIAKDIHVNAEKIDAQYDIAAMKPAEPPKQ